MEKPAYRTGLVCTVDGVDYWHTGSQYWLSHSPDETHQFDLREIPGFKRVETEFDGYTRLFYSQRWKVAGQRNAAIRQSVEMLLEHAEQLWWEAVSDFLQARHLESALRTRAIHALGSGGLSDEEIRDSVPDFTVSETHLYRFLSERDEELQAEYAQLLDEAKEERNKD